MTEYEQWRKDALAILANYTMALYSLDSYVQPYTVELVNLLMRKHLDKVKQATTLEICMKLISDAAANVFGYAVDITYYIPNKKDIETLYMIFSAWRAAFLKEIEGEKGIEISASLSSSSKQINP